MASVLPFKGSRFDVSNKRLFSLVCPPYDELSQERRDELLLLDAENLAALELPGGEGGAYELAHEALERLFSVELLRKDRAESYYIYQMEYFLANSTKTVEYIVGRCALEPFSSGVVLPHENPMPAARDDRLALLESCRANLSPISAIYSDPELTSQEIIDEALKNSAPLHVVETSEVTHRLFAVSDSPTLWRIGDLFKDKQLVLADGHNRYEAALAYKRKLQAGGETIGEDHPANYIMMALCAAEHPGLCVFPAHRVVAPIEGFNSAELLELLKEDFEVDPVTAQDSARALVSAYLEGNSAFLLYDGRWYSLLTLKELGQMKFAMPTRGAALRSLDVSVLQTLVFEKIFNITKNDIAAGRDVSYTHSTWRAEQLVDQKEACCAFLLNPTRIDQILAVARENERMPLKSTYFYPKLLTGLVINKM